VALKLASLLGLLVFPALAWLLSVDRRRFPWRAVLWGVGLQCALAVFILKTRPGRAFFELARDTFLGLIGFAGEGAALVFGPLAKPEVLRAGLGAEHGLIFAVTVTATILLVSALSSLLYHWGVLPRVVQGMAWVMRRLMGTSGSESLAAAANIFMGQTEAPLLVKPYLPGMTRSELLALMVGGMATLAGGVLAAYVGFGISAGHLLTASVMNAPAGLFIAKILIPETQPSETAAGATARVPRETINSIEALCRGAADGLVLALNVLAMVLVFVAVVALANHLFGLAQTRLAALLGAAWAPVTLQQVVGWAQAPLAWLMGVPAADCAVVGRVLGERVVLNEFIGYLSLADLQKSGALQERSVLLATYALCGFANFGSVAIQIGGIGALAPARRADLARLGLRALAGGLLACYTTASLVGLLL
jgi:CNT family concentrative nucleoside transporter